jgi:hypothetical protein
MKIPHNHFFFWCVLVPLSSHTHNTVVIGSSNHNRNLYIIRQSNNNCIFSFLPCKLSHDNTIHRLTSNRNCKNENTSLVLRTSSRKER